MNNDKNKIEKYISLLEASQLCEYSQEYLSLRARQGKLKAVKMGRNWVTTQEWLNEYVNNNNLLKELVTKPLVATKTEGKSLLKGGIKKSDALFSFSPDEIKKVAMFWKKKEQKREFAGYNIEKRQLSKSAQETPQILFWKAIKDIYIASKDRNVSWLINRIKASEKVFARKALVMFSNVLKEVSEAGLYIYNINILEKDIKVIFAAPINLFQQGKSFYKNHIKPVALLWRLRISGFWRYQFAFPAKEYVFASPPKSNFARLFALILVNTLMISGVAMAGFGDLTFEKAGKIAEDSMAKIGKMTVAVLSNENYDAYVQNETHGREEKTGRGKKIDWAVFGEKTEKVVISFGKEIRDTGGVLGQEFSPVGRELAGQANQALNKAKIVLSDTSKLLSDTLNRIKSFPDIKDGLVVRFSKAPDYLNKGVKKGKEAGGDIVRELEGGIAIFGQSTQEAFLRTKTEFYYLFYQFRYYVEALPEKGPEKAVSAWLGFKDFVLGAVETEKEFNRLAEKSIEKATDFENWFELGNSIYKGTVERSGFAAGSVSRVKAHFADNFEAGIKAIKGAYGNSGGNIAVKWGELERKNEELKQKFNNGVYVVLYKVPRSLAIGIKKVDFSASWRNASFGALKFASVFQRALGEKAEQTKEMLKKTGIAVISPWKDAMLAKEASEAFVSAPKNILEISQQTVSEVLGWQKGAKIGFNRKVAAIEAGLQSTIEDLPEIVADGSQEVKDIIIGAFRFVKDKAVAIWNWPFDRLKEKIIGEKEIVQEETTAVEKELAEQKITIQQKTQEVSKIVQPIIEITKKLITETKYETIIAPELETLRAKDESLQSQIVKVSGELSILSGKFPVFAFAPINAPVNVGASGFNVSGHSTFLTLGVSGDASIGRNLSVTNSTSLGNANSAEDIFNIFAHTTFSAPVTIASSLHQSASDQQVTFAGNVNADGGLDVSGDFNVTGTTTLASNLDLGGNLSVGGNSTLGNATTSDLLAFNSRITTSLFPSADNVLDLGDPINWLRWRTGYFGASVGIAGTATSSGSSLIADGSYAINSYSDLIATSTAGNLIFATNGLERMRMTSGGFLGIGTSTPYSRLSVWGAGTATTSLLELTNNASTTLMSVLEDGTLNIPVGTATTTIGGGLAVDGETLIVDYQSSRIGVGTTSPYSKLSIWGNGASGNRIFELINNASTSLFYVLEDGNINIPVATATTTIGGGLQVGGTTGLYVLQNGNVGIGTTSPGAKFEVTGGTIISGTGSGITFTGTGNHDINAAVGTLRLGSNVIIGNIEALDNSIDIGTAAVRFDKIYATELNAINLVGDIVGGNVIPETLSINSDNVTNDTENSYLAFERGVAVPNALLAWDSTNDKFDFNQPVFMQNDSATTTSISLDVWGATGQWVDVLRIASSSGDTYFNVTRGGFVGIGTTSPYAKLSVAGGAVIDGTLSVSTLNATTSISAPYFTATSLTQASTFSLASTTAISSTEGAWFATSGGNVGIGTTSPYQKFSISGNMAMTGAFFDSADSAGVNNYVLKTTETGTRWVATSTLFTIGVDTLPAGITGQTIYNNVGAWAASSNLYHNGTNVGIGTTSPYAKLSVVGQAVAEYFSATSTAATSTFAGGFVVETSGLVYDFSSNNVGINTASPAYTLDVNGTLRAVSNVFFDSHTTLGNATTSDIVFLNSRLADSLVPTADNVLDLGDPTNWLRWRTGYFGASVGIAGAATTTGTSLAFNGAGNISMGAASIIDVLSGTLSINTTNNQAITFGTGNVILPYASTTALTISNTASTTNFYVSGNQYLSPITAGSILFAGIDGLISQDNANFFWDDSGDKLGIGSSTPATALSVNGDGYLTGGMGLGIATSTDGVLQATGMGYFGGHIYAGGTGTSTIANNLNIQGTLQVGTGSSYLTSANLNFSAAGSITTNTGALALTPVGGQNLNINLATTGDLVVNTNQFYVDTSESKIGIGTTSPQAKLEIVNTLSGTAASQLYLSNLDFATSTASQLTFRANDILNATSTASITSTITQNYLTGKGNLSFSTLRTGILTEAVRIDDAGFMGIGTTSPYAKLSVAGGAVIDGTLSVSTLNATTSISAPYFTATSLTQASTFPYASTTAISSTGGAWFATSGGNVGIGTTTPAGLLNVASTLPYLYLTDTNSTADNKHWFLENNAGVLSFGTTTDALAVSDTRAMSILNNGNVGIGTTMPADVFSVYRQSGSTIQIKVTNDSALDNAYAQLNASNGTVRTTLGVGGPGITATGAYAASQGYVDFNGANGLSIASINAAGVLRFYTGGSAAANERMRITSTGNVGIGTTGPGFPLHVTTANAATNALVSVAGFGVTSTGAPDAGFGPKFRFQSEGDDGDGVEGVIAEIGAVLTGGTGATQYNGAIVFNPRSTGNLNEAMRINYNGNVGIGTTSPGAKLEILGTNRSTLKLSTGGGSAQTFIEMNLGGKTWQVGAHDGFSNYTDFGIVNRTDSILTFNITSGGNVGIGDTSPDYKLDVWGTICQDTDSNDVCDGTVTSDAALKKNVEAIDSPLEKLSQLEGVYFDWDENNPATEHLGRGVRHVGLIAQNVEQIFPSLVYSDMQGYKMIDYQKLVAPLIGGVNELNQRTIGLDSEIGALASIYISALGNVSIGTTTAVSKLNVGGDVAAEGFVNISTREAKENISYLNETQYDEALEKIMGAKVARYEYKGDANDSNCHANDSNVFADLNRLCEKRLGLIAEEAPPEVLSADGKGVDLYKMVSFAWAGMKAQQGQIDKIKMDIEELRSLTSDFQLPISNSGGGFSLSSILSSFKSLGAVFENNWFKAKNIAGEMFHIRKNAVPEENSIGETIIPMGETFVIVQNKFVKTSSQIFLTPKVPLRQSLAITEIKEGESFKVELAEAETKDIRFAWLIIGTLEPELDTENPNDQIQMSNQIQSSNEQKSENPNVQIQMSNQIQSSNDQTNVANEQQEPPVVEQPEEEILPANNASSSPAEE